MTPRLSRRFAVAMLFAGLLPVLGGCLGGAPATRLYMLSPLQDAAEKTPVITAGNGKPVSLVIREVRVPQYLDRPQIVTRGSGHRLVISEFDQWGGDLREHLTRILGENLSYKMGRAQVVTAPYPMALQADYRIDVELLHFERDADGQARLAARWWLMAGKDSALLATADAAFSVVPADGSYSALVAAMSEIYGDLAQAIAESIRKAGGT